MIRDAYLNSKALHHSANLGQDTMEGEGVEQGNLSVGSSGTHFLTPSKSFSKKRVTASSSIVGAVHSLPEASYTRNKSGDIVESQVGSHGSTFLAGETTFPASEADKSLTIAGVCAFPEQVAVVAQLAQVCRLTCDSSKLEVQECSVS